MTYTYTQEGQQVQQLTE